MNLLRKLNPKNMMPQSAEALRLAAVQGLFWASMAVGNYQTVYLQQNDFPASMLGVMNAIACAVAILAMTFWGMASDRLGSVKKITILVLILGQFLFALVPLIPLNLSFSVVLILIAFPLINFFRVPMAPFIDNLTVRNCAENRLNYGAIRSSGSLFFALMGIFVVNCILPTMGVSSTFWLCAVTMIPAIVVIFFCMEPQGGGRAKRSSMGTGELFKNPAFFTFLIFAFFFYVATAFEGTFLPYLMTSVGVDSTNIGLSLSLRALMEIPFLFFISNLRRRFPLRYLIILGAGLMALECCLLGLFVTGLTDLLIYASLFGLGNGAFLGTATNYVYELAPVHLRATAHGLFVSVSQIAGILGNLLGGFLFDAVGGKMFYLVAGATFLFSIAVFAASFLKKSKGAAANEE